MLILNNATARIFLADAVAEVRAKLAGGKQQAMLQDWEGALGLLQAG